MFKCVDENCWLWNHEECLVGNVLDRMYHKSLTEKANGEASAKESKVPFPLEKMGNLITKARDNTTTEIAARPKNEVDPDF